MYGNISNIVKAICGRNTEISLPSQRNWRHSLPATCLSFKVKPNYNIKLGESTAKALIERIKLNFNARAIYNGKYYSYQDILYENIRLLANYIMGKSDKLQFNIQVFSVKQNDNTNIHSTVLNLTPQECRKLGINKSML